MNGRAKAAARYSDDFCEAIVKGIAVYEEQLKELQLEGQEELEICNIGPDMCEDVTPIPFSFAEGCYCVDDEWEGTPVRTGERG